jgi:hypothetical protein
MLFSERKSILIVQQVDIYLLPNLPMGQKSEKVNKQDPKLLPPYGNFIWD